MIISIYRIKLRQSDNIFQTVTTSATSSKQAIKQVCDALLAPESAVVEVVKVRELI